MTRWSLRRHRQRTQRPVTGAYRLELESGYWPDAYPPHATGYPAPQPGPAQPLFPPPTAPNPFLAREPGAGPAGPGAPGPGYPEPPRPAAGGAWPEVMEQVGVHLLVLAEQMRMSLDDLESDEGDPDRLQKLYKVDHAVTRMRRASRDLRTLAGRAEEELSGIDTSMLDVIRMALSAIERYTQVSIGRVTDFGVLGYAADDVAALLAALLDNATRYSPGLASVSAHLTEDGSVLLRIEDTGIGMSPDGVIALNAMLAGNVPELDDRTGRHTGFPVVHRIARKYSVGVRLAARPAPGNGTIALVTLPPELLCEVPADVIDTPQPPPPPQPREGRVSVLRTARREPPAPRAADGETATGLPRREPGSLRGGQPRPGAGPDPDSGSGDAEPAPERSPEEQSAARRAFADDLAAFSLGNTQDTAVPAPAHQPGSSDPKGTPT